MARQAPKTRKQLDPNSAVRPGEMPKTIKPLDPNSAVRPGELPIRKKYGTSKFRKSAD